MAERPRMAKSTRAVEPPGGDARRTRILARP
jgi:hypothetical protein